MVRRISSQTLRQRRFRRTLAEMGLGRRTGETGTEVPVSPEDCSTTLTADIDLSGLACENLSVFFGGVRAVDDVTFGIRRGEIVGLIGPNGAGKSTLVNAFTGFQKPTTGRITLSGRNINSMRSDQRVREGVVRTFQAVRLFSALSVLENLVAGGLGVGLMTKEATSRALKLAVELDLDKVLDSQSGSLPHGIERRVGIGRALATDPSFLLLDEPAAGLNETESDELGDLLLQISEIHGCGICVIEHDMRLIMSRCERVHVLDSGKTIAMGTPSQIQNDPNVIAAYLGSA